MGTDLSFIEFLILSALFVLIFLAGTYFKDKQP